MTETEKVVLKTRVLLAGMVGAVTPRARRDTDGAAAAFAKDNTASTYL